MVLLACEKMIAVGSFLNPLGTDPPRPLEVSGDWRRGGGCSEGVGEGAGTELSCCCGCEEAMVCVVMWSCDHVII